MADKKDTTPRCAKCRKPVKLVCDNPGANKMLKPRLEHAADLSNYEGEIFFLHANFPARTTFYKLRRELASRCTYEAKG